jgi:hypothetical protein
MKISPDLLPHTEFHKGLWLHPGHKYGWYYFMKKKNSFLISDPSFIDTVDGPLRELVTFLTEKNIRTTPSCSGHHIDKHEIKKIYEGLEEDAEKILKQGLELKDVQSGRKYIYSNAHYHLPWNEGDFSERLSKYQHTGVLGMKLGKRKTAKARLLSLDLPDTRIKEKDNILFILTNEDGSRNFGVWKEITKQVISILN